MRWPGTSACARPISAPDNAASKGEVGQPGLREALGVEAVVPEPAGDAAAEEVEGVGGGGRLTAEQAGAPAVVVEAIKLVEAGFAKQCDEVWLVVCDPHAQRERLAKRGLSQDDAAGRIADHWADSIVGSRNVPRPPPRRLRGSSAPSEDSQPPLV